MVTITGKITRGMGARQFQSDIKCPTFLKEHPELGNCKSATINVTLDCQMDAIPDFTIGPINWESGGRPELFGFVRLLKFESVAPPIETSEAWIYIPYNSAHRLNPYSVEILAPKLDLRGADKCRIYLPGKRVIA